MGKWVMTESTSWAGEALTACLRLLEAHSLDVTVISQGVDGPDTFHVVYRLPYVTFAIGVVRSRSDPASAAKRNYRLGDMVASPEIADKLTDPPAVPFGLAVARWDILEPPGDVLTIARFDSSGTAWWQQSPETDLGC